MSTTRPGALGEGVVQEPEASAAVKTEVETAKALAVAVVVVDVVTEEGEVEVGTVAEVVVAAVRVVWADALRVLREIVA